MITVFVPAIVMGRVARQAEAARAFFVFGYSFVDSGNNNYLATTARADYPPYGIDYPTHTPTGRFSDGLNLPDVISSSHLPLIFSFKLMLSYINTNNVYV